MGILGEDRITDDDIKAFNLQYVYEEKPGIIRRKCGRGFAYIDPAGAIIKCPKEKLRLKSLAVPPSYNNVWYCPLHNGHLQATGFDGSDKKQYFYHESWAVLRERTKFANMEAFGTALPAFRRKISYILNHPKEFAHKEQVLSAMFRILDHSGMRVGSKQAMAVNKTYGLTTLKKRHVDFDNNEIKFEFDGKGGAAQSFILKDRAVADIIRDCEEISGQHFFDYIGEDGERHQVSSGTINAYIKEHMGAEFSAKDFRTWRFSAYFLSEALRQAGKEASVTLKSILSNVAEFSGNTPAVLQSSYIHPGLIDAVRKKNFKRLQEGGEGLNGLRQYENYLLHYLQSKDAKRAFVIT